MKPRIRKFGRGLWICSDNRGVASFGTTPADAYCRYAICVAQMTGFI